MQGLFWDIPNSCHSITLKESAQMFDATFNSALSCNCLAKILNREIESKQKTLGLEEEEVEIKD